MFTPEKTEAALAAEKAGHGAYAIDWTTADDRIRLCHAVESSCHKRIIIRRIAEHYKLHTVHGITVFRLFCHL